MATLFAYFRVNKGLDLVIKSDSTNVVKWCNDSNGGP